MQTVTDFLTSNQTQHLATTGIDGRPKVRPFLFMLEDAGKLYFCTSRQKTVFKEMQAQPYVELCVSGENYSWLRLSGKVRFSEDLVLKAKIQESNQLVKSIYQTPENPEFAIFHLEDAVATITDFSGAPPQIIKL